MNFYATICRKIKIWWNTPCYYSIVNGMPPVYESEEELQELLTDLKKQTDINMTKKTIITMMLALVAVAGTSNAFDFRIDDEDVAIAVNKDVAGNDIPDKETAVGEATNRIHAVEANGGHVGIDGDLRRRLGIFHKILLQYGHDSTTVKPRKGVELIERVWDDFKGAYMWLAISTLRFI